MKTVLIALLMVSAPAWSATSKACTDYVKAAEDLLVNARDRFNFGELNASDIADLEVMVLKAKYTCNLVTKEEYCKPALKAAQDYLASVKQEWRVGQRSVQDIFNAEERLFTTRLACE